MSIFFGGNLDSNESPVKTRDQSEYSGLRGEWIKESFIMDLFNGIQPENHIIKGITNIRIGMRADLHKATILVDFKEQYGGIVEYLSNKRLKISEPYEQFPTLFIEIKEDGFEKVLEINQNDINEKVRYIRVPDKYFVGDHQENLAVPLWIRHIRLAGIYVSNNTQKKTISFDLDGNVKGLEDFKHYSISFWPSVGREDGFVNTNGKLVFDFERLLLIQCTNDNNMLTTFFCEFINSDTLRFHNTHFEGNQLIIDNAYLSFVKRD